MKIKYFLFLLSLILVVSACSTNQFQKLDLDDSYYQLTFGKSVPLELKQRAISVFTINQQSPSIQNNNIEINNYLFKKYDVYAGNAMRALETEISISIDIKVKKNDKFISKTILSTKRFSSIELNPLAEKEMLKFVEEQLINDLIDKLIIEVKLIDL
ncbi:MAG: hypothetical protein VXZ97_02660 [Pseudomonadota bacterium]|nr:hypothetical protein [Pseudomonadota bacterium]